MRTLLAALLLITSPCFGQGEYSKFTNTIRQFYSGSTKQVENTWAILLAEKNIPFVVSDSVAFLYRGEANSVQWMGDFNGWGYYKEVPNQGKRIANSDIWILKMSFPKDARLGLAPHSMRAVASEDLNKAYQLAGNGPIHMHLAEQIAEVDEVVVHHGARHGRHADGRRRPASGRTIRHVRGRPALADDTSDRTFKPPAQLGLAHPHCGGRRRLVPVARSPHAGHQTQA